MDRVALDGALQPLPVTLGGRLRLLRTLARGGMAEVFHAELLGHGGFTRRVVAKRVRPDLVGRGRTAEMFEREARVLASLQHEHIVGVLDFVDLEGGPWLLMEEVDGPSVRQLLSRHRRLHPDVVARIAADTALALDALHTARDDEGTPLGLVHRDLSPDNLAVSGRGIVKLLDFGIVKGAASPSLTTIGALKGKVPYMAPEQLAVGGVDGRTDLWALGVTMYELLGGVRPFVADSDLMVMHAILHDAPPPLRVELPPGMADLVSWLLEKDPAARPSRAGLVADLLDRDRRRRGPLQALLGASEGAPTSRVATASLSQARPGLAAPADERRAGLAEPGRGEGDDDDDLDRTVARLRPPSATRTATGVAARAPSTAQPGWWSLVASLVDDDVVEVDEQSGVVSRVAVPEGGAPAEARTRTAIVVRPPTPPRRAAAAVAPAPATAAPTSPSGPPRAALIGVVGAALGLGVVGLVALLAVRTPPLPDPASPTAVVVVDPPPPPPSLPPPEAPPPPPPASTTTPPTTTTPGPPPPAPPAPPPPAPTTTRPARARSGRLTVLAVPWAEVFVDGRRVGVTPIDDLKVEAGRRRLRLVGPGGEVKRDVTIVAGEAQTVRVSLP